MLMLVLETIDVFIRSKNAANVRQKTIKSYVAVLSNFAKYLKQCEIEDLDDIAIEHIRTWLSTLHNQIAASSVGTYRAIVLCWLRWCESEGYCEDPGWSRIKCIKIDAKEPRFLTAEECKVLISTVDRQPRRTEIIKKRNVSIIRLLIDTGLRESELVNIRIGDVDLVNRSVRVSEMSKSRRQRTVFFGAETLRALRRYMMVRKHVMGEEHDDWLWISHGGNRLSTMSLYRIVTSAAQDAGLRDVKVHTLRHTTATLLIRNGMPIPHVQRLLGHSNINMTMRYTHLMHEDLIEKYSSACPVDSLSNNG